MNTTSCRAPMSARAATLRAALGQPVVVEYAVWRISGECSTDRVIQPRLLQS